MNAGSFADNVGFRLGYLQLILAGKSDKWRFATFQIQAVTPSLPLQAMDRRRAKALATNLGFVQG